MYSNTFITWSSNCYGCIRFISRSGWISSGFCGSGPEPDQAQVLIYLFGHRKVGKKLPIDLVGSNISGSVPGRIWKFWIRQTPMIVYLMHTDIPVNNERVVFRRFITDGTQPCRLLLVHLQVRGRIKALQVVAGARPTGHRHSHLAQLQQVAILMTAMSSGVVVVYTA